MSSTAPTHGVLRWVDGVAVVAGGEDGSGEGGRGSGEWGGEGEVRGGEVRRGAGEVWLGMD